jgi:sulfite exporter TauE/SafE
MCGPLAIAGCTREGAVDKKDTAAYLGARLVAYATVGAIMGHLGASAMHEGWATVGRWTMILLALVCIWQGVRSLRRSDEARFDQKVVQLGRGPRRTSSLLGTVLSLLPRRGAGLGIVTAILPCGVLVAAWGVAAASAHPVEGAAAMTTFAAASAPGLVIALLGRRLGDKILRRIPRPLLAGAWFAVALLLATRIYLSTQTGCGCHG